MTNEQAYKLAVALKQRNAPGPATKEVRLTDTDLRVCLTAIDDLVERIRLTMYGTTDLIMETRRKLATALNVETIVTGTQK